MARTYEDIIKANGYGRLSEEDTNKRNFSLESDSITSQRTLIQQFCNEHKIELNNYLFDDGITGQTFEREGWDNLLKDIEAGKINCVITKDLSRLGRDHSETGYYIEKYFPEHRVRYISINDNWDSKYDSVDMILWKLAYNDVYCADISRKIISILDSKKKMGLYVGSFAPFGYMKNPDNKYVLIPDPNVAHIVREIFDLAYSGLGTCTIANIMNEKKYVTPGQYSGRGKNSKTKEQVGDIWVSGMVRKILENQAYCGDVVQSKRKKASYKSKKAINNPKEDWIVVKDMHEPLVEREVFDFIQLKLDETSRKYNRLPGEQHLLSKLLFCKDCGHRISIRWRGKNKNGRIGYCNYYVKYSKHNVCTPHSIDYDILEKQILDYVKDLCNKYMQLIDTPSLIQDSYKNIKEKISILEKEKKSNLKEIEKIETMSMKIYEDYLNNTITETMYKMMANKKEIELNNAKEKTNSIDKQIDLLNNQLNSDKEIINDTKKIVTKFLNSEVINHDLIHQIIERIEVGEDESITVNFAIKEFQKLLV